MGVDWYACILCGETFCDAGDHGWCEECCNIFCGPCYDIQIIRYKDDYTEDCELYKCDLCSGKVITDDMIVDYFLKTLEMSRSEVEERIRIGKEKKICIATKKI